MPAVVFPAREWERDRPVEKRKRNYRNAYELQQPFRFLHSLFLSKNSQPGVNEIFAFLFVKEKKEIKVKLWLKLLVFHAQFTFWR